MQSEKLLITSGKMPAARAVRKVFTGLWLLNNCPVIATKNALLHLLRKAPPVAPAKALLLPKKVLKNSRNFLMMSLKKPLQMQRFFLKESTYFFATYEPK